MDRSNPQSVPIAGGLLRALRTDSGDATARNYRYQHAYGVMLLVSAWRGDRPYAGIWCEHHEDFLAERTDGQFDAYQIKTRRPELGAWTVFAPEFAHALKRFTEISESFEDRLRAFYFVSNTDFAVASERGKNQRRYAHSPQAFLSHLRGCTTPSEIAPPFVDVFEQLSSDFGCLSDSLLSTLKKVDLVLGPSRGEIDAAIAHEHLARVSAHVGLSALELDNLRDDLVALVCRASSLQVTDPERHLRTLLNPDTPDPKLAAKWVQVDVIAKSQACPGEAGDERSLGALHSKIDLLLERVAASGSGEGLNRAQMLALLKAFSEEDVDDAEALPLLLRKAEELRNVKEVLEDRAKVDFDNRQLLENILHALEAGEYKHADDLLERLTASGAADRAAALEDTVRLYGARAALARAQLRYDVAAEHVGIAVGVAMSFDKGWAFALLGGQVQDLVDHARMRPGVSGFDVAIQLCARRRAMAPKGTRPHLEATVQLVGTLGLYAERETPQGAAVALETALELGRPIFGSLNPEENLDDWLCLASNLGATLNHASRAAPPEKFNDLSHETIALLTRAAEVAAKHKHPECAIIELNLATAFRLRSRISESPRDELSKAVVHRIKALEQNKDASLIEMGNAYDSLGNDYTAIATLGPTLDSNAFNLAMAAYRRARRFRIRPFAPINWARTQFNIAVANANAASLKSEPGSSKHWNTALFRLDWVLSELDAKGAPHDWTNASILLATILVSMLDDGHVVREERIGEVIMLLADVGDFGDRTCELEMILRVLELQSALNTRIYIRRLPNVVKVLEFERGRLLPRRDAYRNTKPSTWFELAYAQIEIMLADLYSDKGRAEKACETAEASRALATEAGLDWLATHVDEVLMDMRGVVARLSA